MAICVEKNLRIQAEIAIIREIFAEHHRNIDLRRREEMWNRYIFFTTHIIQSSDPTSNLYSLQTLDITCHSSGNNHLFFGDSEGGVTMCNQIYSINRFIAHDSCINFMYQCQNSNLLYTVGNCKDIRPEYVSAESKKVANQYRSLLKKNDRFSWILDDLLLTDEVTCIESLTPMRMELKVWNLANTNENGVPQCLRTIEIFQKLEEEVITSFYVSEDEEMILFGSEKGHIFYLQGDVLRTNFNMLSILPPSFKSPITSLYLSYNPDEEDEIAVYATTLTETGCYLFPRNSRKTFDFVIIDSEHGCEKNCSCINTTGEFIIGSDENISIFTPSGLKTSYPIKGKKKYVIGYKDSLVVASFDENGQQVISILNLSEQIIEFMMTMFRNGKPEFVSSIFSQWGSLFVLSRSHTMFLLEEKDLRTKLRSLYEKNQYDIALVVAQNAGMDYLGILDIHRIYADYLYKEDRNEEAINEYIKTIGYIEPSYVIRKFLDAQHLPQLTSYLEALHEQGLANSEHTTLLINCYTKLKEKEKLHLFIYSDQAGIHFDIEMAVEVLRRASCYEEALHLSKKHHLFMTYLRIELEDQQQYDEALAYIKELPAELAATAFQVFGKDLLAHRSNETTNLLIQLCLPRDTTFNPEGSEKVIFHSEDDEETLLNGSCIPDNFIQCFVDQPVRLKQFLRAMLKYRKQNDGTLWNTSLELFLRKEILIEELEMKEIHSTEEEVNELYKKDVMDLLENPDACYDVDQALVLVQMHDFKDGLLFLYRKLHMYSMMIKYYLSSNETTKVIELCKEYGREDSSLWIQLLTVYSDMEEVDMKQLIEVLDYLHENQIITPLMALQILSKNSHISLSMLKKFIISCIVEKQQLIKEDEGKIGELKESIAEMEEEINDIKVNGKTIQQKKCQGCKQELDLPSIHFMCGHSYHKNCVDLTMKGCPYCSFRYQKEFVMPPPPTEESYFEDMKHAKDGFEVNADYIGKRLYSKPAEKQESNSTSFVDLSDDALDAIPMETLEL